MLEITITVIAYFILICGMEMEKGTFIHMNKLMIMSIFPAPYRTGVFKYIKENFNAEVFFERSTDDNRNSEWFENKNSFYVLDNNEGKLKYEEALKKFNNKDLFLFYDYTSRKSIYLILKCILFKKKYILNCDGAILKPNFFRDILKYFLISNASAYFVSGKIAENYFAYYGAKRENIYHHTFSTLYDEDILDNVISMKDKYLIKKKLGINEKKMVLAVGRFIKLKNYDVLIKAWNKVDSDCKLIIIGGGEERTKYETLIKQYGLNNIELIDYKTKDELSEYYQAADLFVHPTSSDVWGLVINEAMAHGLPLVTTDNCVAGLELIQDNENGYIVPVGDDISLAEKVNTILNDNELCGKMAKNNLEKIREYTIENMADVHMKVIKKMLQGVR